MRDWLTNASSQVLAIEGGFTIDTIAEHTIEYLNAKGAPQKHGQGKVASEAFFLDTATIKQVLDHGVNTRDETCPDGSQAKDCCVIL